MGLLCASAVNSWLKERPAEALADDRTPERQGELRLEVTATLGGGDCALADDWSASQPSTLNHQLHQLFLNELKHEVDEFVQAGGEIFFNRGEVIRFGFAVVLAVLAAGFAPSAGVEGIDQGDRTD
jgi:hypothetical protein